MLAVVTGAAGFIGFNLVRQLVADGFRVRAADISSLSLVDGIDVEQHRIDVLDPATLRSAFEGADVVFHLAAMISIAGDPTGMLRRVNVQGAHNAATAALDVGVERYVHCSSVHAFDLETCGPSLDETGPPAVGAHVPLYDRSKYDGEQRVRSVIEQGLDAVIVNPTGVIGPHDHAPSRTGTTIARFLDGGIPVTIGGGFDFVDVRDVVDAMIASVARGRTGENYLLSGTRISIHELGQLVAAKAGTRPPKLSLPLGLVAPFASLVHRLTPVHLEPIFTPDSMHALRFSPSVSHYKAATDLGFTARPIHVTINDTVEWIQDARDSQRK
jgi:dihydroflavonol-4-reductase